MTTTETNEIQISHPLYLSGCIKKSQFRLEQSQKDRIPWKNLKGRGATEREREGRWSNRNQAGRQADYIKKERTEEGKRQWEV